MVIRRTKALAGLALVLGGCGGQTEGACQAPRLALSSDTVKPGDELSVTWEGLLECEGESLLPSGGKIGLAIAQGPQDLEEPISEPSPVVDNWAQIDGEIGSETEAPSVTAAIPVDMNEGEYYIYVADPGLFLYQSSPFTVVEG
jgi:hypothetical protein